jgi:hypothetical protein
MPKAVSSASNAWAFRAKAAPQDEIWLVMRCCEIDLFSLFLGIKELNLDIL